MRAEGGERTDSSDRLFGTFQCAALESCPDTVLANEPGMLPMFSRLKGLDICGRPILLLIKVAMLERLN